MQPSPQLISELADNEVFVFGSNTEGRHGAGAAKQALTQFGAVFGKGVGFVGQTYAIPTKKFLSTHGKWKLCTMNLDEIAPYVTNFINFTKVHKELNFLVTEIGCGYAHYHPYEIAPLFSTAKDCANIFLPQSFIDVLMG